LARAATLAAAVGDRVLMANVERFSSRLARVRGDAAAAQAHVERALELAGEPSLERAAAFRELALLRAAQGRSDEERDALRSAGELYRALGAEWRARDAADALAASLRHSLPAQEER
ncbi:MAG TPA: hypothetical protein VJT67_11610, partial [Longimicrobiaceae bacterium]|nr:hypothetical protein [Longimicrobiaceae bacterium]